MAFIYNLSDTWNDAGVTFTGIGLNVTDSASASASKLLDLRVGGVSKFSVSKSTVNSTTITLGSNGGPANIEAQGNALTLAGNNGHNVVLPAAQFLRFGAGFGFLLGTGAQVDSPILFGSAQEANHTIAQRNGTNPQAFRIYNTYTDASNYERGKVEWSSNVLRIGTEKAGTGTVRALEFQTDGVTRLTIDTNGQTLVSGNFGVLSGTLSIIAGGARQFFMSGSAFTLRSTASIISMGADGTGANPDLDVRRVSAGILRLSQNGSNIGGALEMVEATAPAAPAANSVRIYAEDDGAGKTRLMALFATGVAQQIAIEP